MQTILKNIKRLSIPLVTLIGLSSSVMALEMRLDSLPDMLSWVFETLHELFSNDYVAFGFVIILLVVLLRNVFAAALARVHIFEGGGGEGINSIGSTISWTLALMSGLSVIYFSRAQGVSAFLKQVLGPAGLYGGIAAIGAIFWMFNGTFDGKKHWALLATAVCCLPLYGIFQSPILYLLGLIMFVMAFILIVKNITVGTVHLAQDLQREEEDTEDIQAEVNDEGRQDDRITTMERNIEGVDTRLASLDTDFRTLQDAINRAVRDGQNRARNTGGA